MPLFNTKQHPWVAKVKRRAARAGIRLTPAALRIFEPLAVNLSSLRTPLGSRYFKLPRDFCVSATKFDLFGKKFSLDISLDYPLSSSGQAVQASFLVEENGAGWAFLLHDPTIGVVKREWYPAPWNTAKNKREILLHIQLFIAHLQSNHP